MARSRVLKLKTQGYKVAEIAKICGMTTSEVTREIVAERERREASQYVPSLEEIAAAKREINRAKGMVEDLR